MKDEIKEILDILQKCKDYDDEVYLIKQHGATLLLDYITNLQEENEKNKEYSEFYKDMSDKWKELSGVFKKSCEDYKVRIDKAIEYINKSIDNHMDWYNYIHGDEDGEVHNLDILLNILQGKSDE